MTHRPLLIALLALLLVGAAGVQAAQGGHPLMPNLVPEMDHFDIRNETFGEEDPSVLDECVEPGRHRVLRFDVSVRNVGPTRFYVGSPDDNPENFVYSESHGHHHIRNFNKYTLSTTEGEAVIDGAKQAFCLMDLLRWSNHSRDTGYFTCMEQGISPGWGDVYVADLPCQFVVIDDVPDGDYILEVTINAQQLVAESSFDDNVLQVRLRLEDNDVMVLD